MAVHSHFSSRFLCQCLLALFVLVARLQAADMNCPATDRIETEETEESLSICRWYEFNNNRLDCKNGQWPYLDEVLAFCQSFKLRRRLHNIQAQNWIDRSTPCTVHALKDIVIAEENKPEPDCPALEELAASKQVECYLSSGLCCLDPQQWVVIAFTLQVAPTSNKHTVQLAINDYRESTYICSSPATNKSTILEPVASSNSSAEEDGTEEASERPDYRMLRLDITVANSQSNDTQKGNAIEEINNMANDFITRLGKQQAWDPNIKWVLFPGYPENQTVLEDNPMISLDILLIDKDVMDGMRKTNDRIENTIDQALKNTMKSGNLAAVGQYIIKDAYYCLDWWCYERESLKPDGKLTIGDGGNANEKVYASTMLIFLSAAIALLQ